MGSAKVTLKIIKNNLTSSEDDVYSVTGRGSSAHAAGQMNPAMQTTAITAMIMPTTVQGLRTGPFEVSLSK